MPRLITPLILFLSLLSLVSPALAQTPPPAEADAPRALETTPRHTEYARIAVAGSQVPLNTFVAYPERSDAAPVVIVIHEIYGLSDWIKGVADRLAADGFIALAPDLLSGRGPGGGGTDAFESRDQVVQAIRGLSSDEVVAALDAVRAYGLALPSAAQQSGCVGFCWGGSTSFMYATRQPGLDAAVVYYGTSPAEESAYEALQVPVMGQYGGDDNRVTSTVPRAEEAARKFGKTYEPHIHEGAGHGFLRAQQDREGANLRAAKAAWEATIGFLRRYLETDGGR